MALTRTRTDLCRARDAADPRRRQLAGPRDAGGRPRRAGLRRAAARARTSRTSTATATSTGCMSWGPLIFGHADPETVEAVREAAADGTTLRRADRARGRARGGDRRRGAVGRAGAARLAPGTEAAMSAIRLARARDAPRPGAQVRRLLPRPRRRAARERGLGRRDARDPVDARACRPASRPTRSSAATTTSTRSPRRVERYGEGLARDHRRARRREHGRRPARARLPRGAARALRRDRARCSSSTR